METFGSSDLDPCYARKLTVKHIIEFFKEVGQYKVFEKAFDQQFSFQDILFFLNHSFGHTFFLKQINFSFYDEIF